MWWTCSGKASSNFSSQIHFTACFSGGALSQLGFEMCGTLCVRWHAPMAAAITSEVHSLVLTTITYRFLAVGTLLACT